jgi:hypothetical protein
MKKNMGRADSSLRLLVSIVIVALYFTDVITGTLGLILLIVAVVFAATSFINFCPLYTIFGMSTCKK